MKTTLGSVVPLTLFLLFFRPIHEKSSMKLMNILVFLVFLQTHEQFLGAIAEVIWGEGLEKKRQMMPCTEIKTSSKKCLTQSLLKPHRLVPPSDAQHVHRHSKGSDEKAHANLFQIWLERFFFVLVYDRRLYSYLLVGETTC